MSLTRCDWSLFKKTETHGEEPHDHQGRDRRDAAASPGTQPPEAGRGQEGFCPESQRECRPADTLVLDLWPPELRENKSLLFKPWVCGSL